MQSDAIDSIYTIDPNSPMGRAIREGSAGRLYVMPDKATAMRFFDILKSLAIGFKLRPYAGRFGFFLD